MPGRDGTGPNGMGSVRGGGRGRAGVGGGRIRGPFAAGPGGFCICPKCTHKIPHIAGQPCSANVCPECGTRMVRG